MSHRSGATSKILLALFVVAAIALAPGHIATPDAHLRLAQARIWLETGSLSLPPEVGVPEHGNIAILPDGTRHSVYAPGQSLTFLPLLYLSRSLSSGLPVHYHYLAEFFASFLGLFCHAVTSWLVFQLARQLGRDDSAACTAAIVYGFASYALPASADGYEHPQEALALVAAFLLAVRASQSPGRDRWFAAGAGLAMGVGATFRPTIALGYPGILLLLPSWRSRAHFVGSMVPFALVLGLYNEARFGSPLETGYGLAWPLSRPLVPPGAFFSTPLLHGLAGLLISPGKGLLWYSPVVPLWAAGLAGAYRRQRRVVLAAVLIAGAYLVFYAKNFAWHGSAWSWGPRYISPVLPLLAWGLPEFGRTKPLWRRCAIVVVVWSLYVQATAMAVDYRRHLVEAYAERMDVFANDELLFAWREWPPLTQTEALMQMSPARPLRAFVGHGPWLNGARPASQRMMLDESIDFNAPNVWWVRVQYLPLSVMVRSVCLFVGTVASMATVYLALRVRRVARQ